MVDVTIAFLLRNARDLRVSLMLGLLALLPAAPALGFVPVTTVATDEEDRQGRPRAHVIHIPGIAGPRRIDRNLADGIAESGVASQVEIFDWVGNRRGLAAVFGVNENRRQARKLAERVLELKRQDVARPVVLVAHSGGTAIVAWALEVLPEVAREAAGGVDVAEAPEVVGVVMLASGLSPEYDLARAMRQVSGMTFHLSSTADNYILGAGTLLFGTLDRKFGVAAGKTGFYLPMDVDPLAYARFIEIPYDQAWRALGHYGDHEGMMSRGFGRLVVANLVRASLGENVELPATRPAIPAPATRPTTQPAPGSDSPALNRRDRTRVR